MADKNYEDDFSPMYAIGYPKTVGEHFGEYEILKVGVQFFDSRLYFMIYSSTYNLQKDCAYLVYCFNFFPLKRNGLQR